MQIDAEQWLRAHLLLSFCVCWVVDLPRNLQELIASANERRVCTKMERVEAHHVR